MTPAESRLLRAAHGAVALTGLAWAWMIFFVNPDDPYAVVNHPWQPSMQSAHVLAAPVFILAVGMIWQGHAWSRIRSGFPGRRRSGMLLSGLFLPMALSGYFLQVSVDPTARSVWRWMHLATSCAWIYAWWLHRRAQRRA